jgi:hypothetical protein
MELVLEVRMMEVTTQVLETPVVRAPSVAAG